MLGGSGRSVAPIVSDSPPVCTSVGGAETVLRSYFGLQLIFMFRRSGIIRKVLEAPERMFLAQLTLSFRLDLLACLRHISGLSATYMQFATLVRGGALASLRARVRLFLVGRKAS